MKQLIRSLQIIFCLGIACISLAQEATFEVKISPTEGQIGSIVTVTTGVEALCASSTTQISVSDAANNFTLTFVIEERFKVGDILEIKCTETATMASQTVTFTVTAFNTGGLDELSITNIVDGQMYANGEAVEQYTVGDTVVIYDIENTARPYAAGRVTANNGSEVTIQLTMLGDRSPDTTWRGYRVTNYVLAKYSLAHLRHTDPRAVGFYVSPTQIFQYEGLIPVSQTYEAVQENVSGGVVTYNNYIPSARFTVMASGAPGSFVKIRLESTTPQSAPQPYDPVFPVGTILSLSVLDAVSYPTLTLETNTLADYQVGEMVVVHAMGRQEGTRVNIAVAQLTDRNDVGNGKVHFTAQVMLIAPNERINEGYLAERRSTTVANWLCMIEGIDGYRYQDSEFIFTITNLNAGVKTGSILTVNLPTITTSGVIPLSQNIRVRVTELLNNDTLAVFELLDGAALPNDPLLFFKLTEAPLPPDSMMLITQKQFSEFVTATGFSTALPLIQSDEPQFFTTREEAAAYCNWRSNEAFTFRLPTEGEWRAADNVGLLTFAHEFFNGGEENRDVAFEWLLDSNPAADGTFRVIKLWIDQRGEVDHKTPDYALRDGSVFRCVAVHN